MGTFPKTRRPGEDLERQALLEALPGGLLYLDDDGCVAEVQAAAGFGLFRALGIRPGQALDAALPPTLRRALRRALERAAQTGQVQCFEDHVEADRARRSYQFRLVPAGAGTHLVVVRDATAHRQLETLVLEISERERRRLGEDFHDDVGQTLNAVWFMSASIQKKLAAQDLPEAQALQRISDLLKRVMQQFRGLVRGLNTVDLSPHDLVPALETYAASVEQIYLLRGVSCAVVAGRDVAVPGRQAAIQLYRIAQEAVTNAVRHGRATAVEVRLSRADGGGLRLCVQDNGVGIAPAGQRGHGFGLRIMRRRARLIDAALHLRRLDEGGTCVTCTLPPSPDASEAAGLDARAFPD